MTACGSAPALILGGGITALGVLRSLGRAGIRTISAFPPGDVGHLSRWCDRAIAPPAGEPSSCGLLRRLDEERIDRVVPFPCSDQWAQVAAELAETSPRRFPASLPPAAVIRRLIDKAGLRELLADYAVPHPRTVDLHRASDLRALPDAAFSHAFLKPRDSHEFLRRFGVKAIAVRDRAEALRQFARVAEQGLGVVLQEYVPGPPTAHVFVDGFRDGAGEVSGLLVRRRLRMHPPDFGNSTAMITIPPEEARGAVEPLVRLLEGVGYRGLFSAEFKQDPRDGVFRLLEINARAWWYVDFADNCGVPLCAQAYRDALGRPVAPSRGYPAGVRCVYPYEDWHAWLVSRSEGGPSLWATMRSWLGARQPIFAWEDPLPGLLHLARLVRDTTRRRLRHEAKGGGRRPRHATSAPR